MEIGLVQRVETTNAEAWANAILNINAKEVGVEEILSAFVKNGYDSTTKCAEIYKMYKDMVI